MDMQSGDRLSSLIARNGERKAQLPASGLPVPQLATVDSAVQSFMQTNNVMRPAPSPSCETGGRLPSRVWVAESAEDSAAGAERDNAPRQRHRAADGGGPFASSSVRASSRLTRGCSASMISRARDSWITRYSEARMMHGSRTSR